MINQFLKILVFGLVCLVLAAVFQLIGKFAFGFSFEWEIAAVIMVLFCLANPFLFKINDYTKKIILYSLFVTIALFFDLTVLSALVSWQPISQIWFNITPLVAALMFFPLSWFFRFIFK